MPMGDVDQEDFGHIQACVAGYAAVAESCADADLSGDRHVNRNDLGVFQGCMSGAHVPTDPDCVN